MAEESVDLRKERAKSSTSPEELEKLAGDKDKGVRSYVAENVNTPVSMLEKQKEKDDKVKALQLESFEKTVEKINNWISESGKPIRCFSDYIVWQNEREEGTFTVKKDGKSEEIEGYMMWENKSSVTFCSGSYQILPVQLLKRLKKMNGQMRR